MDDIKKLYQNFKKALVNGSTEDFYDEEDLLNVYDYAGDERDLFVQFEVLRIAGRLYPDSPEFGSRSAFFLKDVLDEPAGAMMLARRHKDDSFGWSVLNLSYLVDPEQVKEELEKLLISQQSLEDDDVLRLVDLCEDNSLQQWLYDSRKRILALCAYPDTFLLELAELEYEQGDFSKAVQVLDELTEIEPFNATAWSRLADTHAVNRNLEEALSAVDYAIAIAPEKSEYVIQRIRLKYYCATTSDKDMTRLMSIIEKEPDNIDALNLLFGLMLDRGDSVKIIDTFMELIAKCNRRETIINIAEKIFMLNDREAARRVVEEYVRDHGCQLPENWVERLFAGGNYTGVIAVLTYYIGLDAAVKGPTSEMLLESLYRMKEYKTIVDIYLDPELELRRKYREYDDCLFPMFIVALALLREENEAEFKELAGYLLNVKPVLIENFRQRLAASAAFSILHAITQFMANGTSYQLESFDPFTD